MAYIKFNNNKIDEDKAKMLIELCPFQAIEKNHEGLLQTNAACKNCKICIKKGPDGCVEFVEDNTDVQIDKSEWKGIVVFAEHLGHKVNPVAFELLNKAKELASVINNPVYALWIGDSIEGAEELLHYGADKVYAYIDDRLKYFSVLQYANVFEDFINKIKPNSVLVGATNMGRSLGPRVAARFKTGMTADCTKLEMNIDSNLVQIRPAFGGNIMAKILTSNTRPQFCTVREKIFSAMDRLDNACGSIEEMPTDCINLDLDNAPEFLELVEKPKSKNIADADVLVVLGRGLRRKEDKVIFQNLADKLGGMLASSRALVETGWMPADRQIGLSGKTVRPKLMITFGVSGSVQFAAGMNSCEYVVSVNTNKNAPIFNIANVCICADMYEIANSMIAELEK